MTLNLNRISSKLKTFLPDKMEATMTITNNKKEKETVEVFLNTKSLIEVSSGFLVTLQKKTDKIINTAFFLAGVEPNKAPIYFLPFRNFVSSIGCDSANFIYYKNGLNFYINDQQQTYTLNFLFPKSFIGLIGNKFSNADVNDLCKKVTENIVNFASDSRVLKTNAAKYINDAMLLDEERNSNIKTAEAQNKFISEQEEKKKKMESERAKIEKAKSDLDAEIAESLRKQHQYQSNMNSLDDQILAVAKLAAEKASGAPIRVINEADVNKLYVNAKEEIERLAKLHSDKDPQVKILNIYADNVKAQQDKILESFK